MFSNIRRLSTTMAALAFLIVPVAAAAQDSPTSLTGKYAGMVKDESGEHKTTLDLVEDAGKFSGTCTTANGSFKILKGQTANGDRKSTRLNSSHIPLSRMPSSA